MEKGQTVEQFDWDKVTGYQKVVKAVTEVLKAHGATSRKTVRGGVIKREAYERFPLRSMPVGTFYVYLSQAAHDETTGVYCDGPWQGYYLSSPPTASETVEGPAVAGEGIPEVPQRREREAKLYRFAEDWLKSKGYRCKDTSGIRMMGKWGNPDVTGLCGTDVLGKLDIEVATIEVKPSLPDWEYWIFEAIAHRRFSHRAYFAFCVPIEQLPKLPRDLSYYSELYGVGVLAFLMQADTFSRFQTENVKLDPSDVEVREVCPAPYQQVQARHLKRFLRDGLGIAEPGKAATWGSALDENEADI
jgi:hypothetical protein